MGSSPIQSIGLTEQIPISQNFDKDWDIYNTKGQFLRECGRIKNWDTTELNKSEILRFLRKTEIEGIGIVQRLKYIYAFKSFFECD